MMDYMFLVFVAQILMCVLSFTVLADAWAFNRSSRIKGKELMDTAERKLKEAEVHNKEAFKNLKDAEKHNKECLELLESIKKDQGIS